MTRQTAADAIDAVWRIESARLIAGLARLVGDIGVAEDLAQDALVAALEQWPESGVPDNPGAWLMATAKHRAIDHLRRGKMQDRKHGHLGRELDERQMSPESALADAIDDQVGDDLLLAALCEDALRLGRILAELATDVADVHGLVALMEIQASRLRARVTPTVEPILLLDQDRGRWDYLLVGRGLAALERAEALGGAYGPY